MPVRHTQNNTLSEPSSGYRNGASAHKPIRADQRFDLRKFASFFGGWNVGSGYEAGGFKQDLKVFRRDSLISLARHMNSKYCGVKVCVHYLHCYLICNHSNL